MSNEMITIRNDEIKPSRSISKYNYKLDNKGNLISIPVYLRETPEEDITRMNKQFSEWKETKQVKYDIGGMKK